MAGKKKSPTPPKVNNKLEKRGKNSFSFRLRVPQPDGTKKLTRFTFEGTEEDAEQFMLETKIRIKQGLLDIDFNKMTLIEFLRFWINLPEKELEGNTVNVYNNSIENHIAIAPEIANIIVGKFDLGKFELFIRNKTKELSPSSAISIYTTVSSAFTWGVKKKKFLYNPLSGIELPEKSYNFDATLLNALQIKLVTSYLKERNYNIYMATIIASTTGMRVGEIAALHWDDINFEKNIITVSKSLKRLKNSSEEKSKAVAGKTKNKKTRQVPLTSECKKELIIHKESQDDLKMQLGEEYKDNNYVCAWNNGSPIERTYMSKVYKDAIKKLGLPSETRFHDLRHWFATELIEKGVPLKVVSEILGHSSVITTEKMYIKINMRAKQDAVKCIDKALFNSSKKTVRSKKKIRVLSKATK